ncbi:hypothetical protein BpHYR1_014261 [Brachionus plicatilis]|uniref:Uncharacterized protein n=1 Tax=Brachionus plicatilis TaxID=10195 RepID=A0A3M7SW64_BRAPC|nr:hypothetical protein BpHYR1_014261 [Brachionus plicatilis]
MPVAKNERNCFVEAKLPISAVYENLQFMLLNFWFKIFDRLLIRIIKYKKLEFKEILNYETSNQFLRFSKSAD